MSARHLPLQPSLRHLRHEAKQLHQAILDGSTAAAQRARAGLPRLSQAGAELSDITLMEAQHVLAREYGYREWPHLAAAARLTFDDLARLDDVSLGTLLRHVDQKDLVVGLEGAGDRVVDRLLAGMTDRVRAFILEEMEFLGPMPEAEVDGVRQRILQQVRQLAEQGVLGWPPGAEVPPRATEIPPLAPELAGIERPLASMRVEAARRLVHALAARASAHGILSLEAAADAAADGYLAEGLRLLADGTEPGLAQDFLRTRARALLLQLDNRHKVILEGVMSICGRDNPAAAAHKMICVYQTDFEATIEPTGADVGALAERLRQRPASRLDLDGLATWITDAARIARREGAAALAPLVESVDDASLRIGLERLVAGAEMKDLFDAVDDAQAQELVEARGRLWSIADGLAALQEGRRDEELDAVLDAALAAARDRT